MADNPKTFIVPQADIDARARLLTEARANRAHWIHQVLGRLPVEEQPEALAAVLEIERIETEAVHALMGSWRFTVQGAYLQGCIDGGQQMAETLGVVEKPVDKPLTMH
jgi:hypothetical protein